MKKPAIISTLIILTACSTKMLTPAQTDANKVSTKQPTELNKGKVLTPAQTELNQSTQAEAAGSSMKYTAELSLGKALYEQNCGSCHGLKSPKSKTEAQWNAIVPPMVRKVNKKSGSVKIDSTAQATLLKYLITMGPANNAK